MFLIVTKYLIPTGFRGLTAFLFVFVKYHGDKENTVPINHEKIHLLQQYELLILPFFVIYIIKYFFGLVQYGIMNLAY
jgi:hypothetical protein